MKNSLQCRVSHGVPGVDSEIKEIEEVEKRLLMGVFFYGEFHYVAFQFTRYKLLHSL